MHVNLTAAHLGSAPGLVLCVLAAAACGNAPERTDGSARVSVTDSAGVRIAEISAAVLNPPDEWRVDDTPALSIGRTTGDDPYLLSRVAAAHRLSSGEVVIADGQSLELRVFSPDGAFVRKYGGRGEGPGEFRSFAAVSQTDGAHLSIYDEPLGRVARIDLATGQLRTRPAPRCANVPMSAGRCGVQAPFADGTLVGYHDPPRRPMPCDEGLTVRPGQTRRMGMLHGDEFAAVDSVEGAGSVIAGACTSDLFLGTALFEPGGTVAIGGREMIVADPYRYEIRWRDAAGALRQIVRVQAPSQPVTSGLLRQYREWADTASYVPRVTREYLASLEPNGAVPFFGRALVDREGRVWLRDYEPFWAFGPRGAPGWTVMDRDGEPIARVLRLPAGEILEIGADYILLLMKDDLAVERVQLHDIVRPSESGSEVLDG